MLINNFLSNLFVCLLLLFYFKKKKPILFKCENLLLFSLINVNVNIVRF